MDARSAIAHLMRRAGFGGTAAEVDAAAAAGYAATVDTLIGGLGVPDTAADAVAVPAFSPLPSPAQEKNADAAARKAFVQQLARERRSLTDWWLERMVVAANPLREKLTFLLHGQFPTAISKVRFPRFMYGQNQIFRTLGGGDFDTLTQAVAVDPAMLIWLDAASDKASDPNENFARELMERFTMGIGTYTEADVRAAAVCFTGWRLDRTTGAFTVDRREHSSDPQTVLGTSGLDTGQQVIDLVTHSPASARFVPARFWSHLAYPVSTDDPVVADLSAGYAADRNVGNLLRAVFTHPAFTSTEAATGLVKQPTEYVVGALRALGAGAARVASSGTFLQETLAGLGQVLFDPPSVGGWGQNEYWLSTAAALARWRFAQALAGVSDLSPIADEAPSARADAAAHLLSVSSWSAATSAALAGAGGDPATIVTLALVSPEYVSN